MTELTIQASIEGLGWWLDDEPKPTWDVDLEDECGIIDCSKGEYGIEPDDGSSASSYLGMPELSVSFKRTLSEIGRLQNPRHLELIYDEYVSKTRVALLPTKNQVAGASGGSQSYRWNISAA